MNKRHLLFVILCLCLLILPLPWLVRVEPVRQAMLSRLGGPLSGTISSGACSLGWFSGLRCQDVRYQGLSVPLALESAELRSRRGLLPLLLAPGSLGELYLQAPVLTLSGDRAATTAPDDSLRPELPSWLLRWWNRGSFQLRATGSSLRLELNGKSYPLISRGDFEAALENGSLRYALKASAGQGEDYNVQAGGYVNAPPEGSKTQHLLSTGTILLEEVPVAKLPPLPFAPGFFFASAGRATGNCRFVHSADGSVQGEGALFLHDLRLPAFSPHDQRLTLDRTSLLFNLSRQGAAAWQVRQLRLESPLANLDLHGALQPGESDFTAQAALALPLLSEGLRVRLALYPDAKITDGRLQCSMQARGPGERLPMALDCRISDIHAERGGADIVWANPLTLHTKWLMTAGRPRLQQIEGKGALCALRAKRDDASRAFTLEASGELDALSRETGRIMQLPLTAGGTMQLKAGSSPSDTGYQDELDLELQKFSLENGRTRERLLPTHPLTVKMHGSRRSEQGPFSGQLQVSGWPGTLEARWQDIAGQGREQRGTYTVGSTLALARIQPLIRHVLTGLSELDMTGALQLDLKAHIQDGRHEIRSAEVVLTQAEMTGSSQNPPWSFAAARTALASGEAAASMRPPAQKVQPKAVRTGRGRKGRPAPQALQLSALQLAGTPAPPAAPQDASPACFDPLTKSLHLQPLVLVSDALRLDGELRFTNWGQQDESRALRLEGDLQGQALETLLRAVGRMPNGVRLKGPAHLACTYAAPGHAPATAEIAARLGWAGFGQEHEMLLAKQDLNLFAHFETAGDGQSSASWDLPEFSIHGPDFWAQGQGFLLNEGRGAVLLSLSGRYRGAGAARPFQLALPLQ